MTDIMKLIDDVIDYNASDERPRAALQSAIEALQSECAEHKENAMRNARQAVAFRAERDALAAKLDELQRQEPEGWKTPEFWMNSVVTNPDCQVKDNLPHQDNCRWWRSGDFCNCGAAPKALEPLSYVEIEKARKQWLESGEMGTAYHSAVKFAERHHGITKGTP